MTTCNSGRPTLIAATHAHLVALTSSLTVAEDCRVELPKSDYYVCVSAKRIFVQ